MNKFYRTVYSELLGTWVAVSEISSARGKRSGSKVVQVGAAGAVVVAGLFSGGGLSPVSSAYGQTLPEAACTAGNGGTMYSAASTCV